MNELLASGLDAGSSTQLRVYVHFYWRLMDLFGNVKIITSPGVDALRLQSEVFDFVESILAALGINSVLSMDLSESPLGVGDNKYRKPMGCFRTFI